MNFCFQKQIHICPACKRVFKILLAFPGRSNADVLIIISDRSTEILYQPSATFRTVITLNPTAKSTVPMFECIPSDIFGIRSSTAT